MKKTRLPVWEWITVIVCISFFILPMLIMARFALQKVPVSLLGRDTLFSRWTLSGVTATLTDDEFRPALFLSLRIAFFTVAVVLVLMVPTVIWLHLGGKRWRSLVEVISTLPYVVPPIALVVGISGTFRDLFPWLITSNYGLVPFYGLLCLPFAFRTLDAGVASLDLRTLVDASRSLGASSSKTLVSVLIPNLRISIMTTAFLSIAVVLGEYAIAGLLLKPTLPTYMVEAQGQQPQGAMAVALLLLAGTSALFALIGLTTNNRGKKQNETGIVI